MPEIDRQWRLVYRKAVYKALFCGKRENLMKNMITGTSTYLLRQPFLLFATESYQKIEVMRYGISHFYTFQADGTAYDLAEVVPDGCVDIMFVRGRSRSYAIYVGTPLNAYRVDFCHFLKRETKYSASAFYRAISHG